MKFLDITGLTYVINKLITLLNPKNLLEKIKTVDGPDSGLDADTLHGHKIGYSYNNIPIYTEFPSKAQFVAGGYLNDETIDTFTYLKGVCKWCADYHQGHLVMGRITPNSYGFVHMFIYDTGKGGTLPESDPTLPNYCYGMFYSINGVITYFGTKNGVFITDGKINASANNIISNQLITEDLNDIKDNTIGFASYYGIGGNSVINKPDNVSAFSLQVFRAGGNPMVQVLTASEASNSSTPVATYRRVWDEYNNKWWPWKKMLTEDDIKIKDEYIIEGYNGVSNPTDNIIEYTCIFKKNGIKIDEDYSLEFKQELYNNPPTLIVEIEPGTQTKILSYAISISIADNALILSGLADNGEIFYRFLFEFIGNEYKLWAKISQI